MSPYYRIKASVVGVAAPALAAAVPLLAGDPGKAIINDKAPIRSSSFCDIFDHTTLYEGDGFLKSLKFTGRYHGGFIDTEDQHPGGGEDEFWEHRRFRAGFVAKLGGNLTFQNIYNLDTSPHFDGDRFVNGLDELFIKWEPSDDFYITVGKHKPSILRDFAGSSNRLQVFERSFITQNTVNQKLWGVAVGFEALGLNHEVGLWTTHFEDSFQWPTFEDSGSTFVYRTNYKLNDNTKIFFDYEYTDQHRGAGKVFGAPLFENILALGTESKWGDFGLITDFVLALDRGVATRGLPSGDDSHGIVITPYYNVTDKLQLVGRYAYGSDGVVERPQRFASRVGVDDHNSVYLGLQYFICGDKLKLQAGHEWSSAKLLNGADYENNTWLAGVRVSW